MDDRRREVGIPLLLVAAAFALGFVQRPGLATADTKISLHVDPGRFLGQVASMWTPTGQLGSVQAGQQTGYLFPMGPFFGLGHLLGISDWVVQRLWLSTLLALAAWGVVRLLDALLGRPRGIAHLVGGAVTLLNPFVVTYANRTTVTLLAYAVLPWLLLAVHRGLREPRGWRWPAAFALLVTASGGGVNGAVLAWMLLGPLLLVLYELAVDPVPWAQGGRFVLRTVLLGVLVSLWWVVPAYVQSSYGIDFLHFTEQPGTIWGTTSSTESLRLMSFWLSYVGIGFTGRAIPYFDDSRTLLFSAPVVLATLLLPALALTGFVWTRTWRYGPFFLGLALVAVLVMQAGFPEGTPLRHGLTFTYNHLPAVRFLRASYKAAPLLALPLACLAGAGAGEAWRRLRGPATLAGVSLVRLCGATLRGGASFPRLCRAILSVGASLGVLAVLVGAAWPLVRGSAQDAQVSYKRIPPAWRAAAGDLDRRLPTGSRAIVLPGDLFAFYDWGGTVDPILPVLSRRDVAERSEVPYADLRATDLLWTIDGLVHQQRLLPGQLPPLLSLIGVRSVVSGTDDDPARSDAPPPADAARELSQLGSPARTYGSYQRFAPSDLGPPVRLPQVRRYDLGEARGMTRVQSAGRPIIVDGSADALAGLAAFGALSPNRTLLYAADLAPTQLRQALAGGGELVISDSNRREAFVAASLDQNTGPVLTPQQNVSADGIILDPFERGSDYQTVASFRGVRSVEAPSSPERPQFPEHSAFAAIDGSPQTEWLADLTLGAGRRWLQVDFQRPRAVPYVRLLPYGQVRQVQIVGRTFALNPGWNRLDLGLRDAASLRVLLSSVGGGAVGIRELVVPGVHATEQLRLPTDGSSALAGQSLEHTTLTYLFARSTGDDPFRRDLAFGPGDAEQTMRRQFVLPESRSFASDAWVNVFSQDPDDALDRLARYGGPIHATSSSRFDGQPQWRASRALDGDPRTAWVGDYDPAHPAWLQWHSTTPVTVSRLRLRPPAQPVRRPSVVQIAWPGGFTGLLTVGAGGFVTLPHPVRARSFRLIIRRAIAPAGASPAGRRAVGIAEVIGLPGVTEHPPPVFTAPCGAARVRIGNHTIALRVLGSEAAFEHGDPLEARSCGARLVLPGGAQHLVVQAGLFAVDELRLSSAAPTPVAPLENPSLLVYGQGYNRGWRAYCNGRSLGKAAPVDGYANGWPLLGSCRQVRFAFVPDRLATAGYVVSAIAALLCAALLILPLRHRHGRRESGSPAPFPEITSARRLPPLRALAIALPLALLFGFVFGIPAGAASFAAIAVVLWRGVGAVPLTLCAGMLLGIVVPILYLAHPGNERGGNHPGYAVAHLGAHYVGVAAIGLLIGALWRALSSREASRAGRPG